MNVTKIPKKTISVIEPKRSLIVNREQYHQRRVAAYCRVSTDSEEQLTSYTNQKKVYTEMIAAKPEWEFAGLYADEGISGTRADKRPQFQKMINDCLSGKIDYIITKSVSRFARNTVDCLDHVRMLRARSSTQGSHSLNPKASARMSPGLFVSDFRRASPYSTISAFWDTARVQTENRRSSRRRHPSWRGSLICTCQVKPSTGSQPNSEKKISRYQENDSPSLRA